MINRFNQFLENNNSRHLLYYAFDWDDNILYMPTKIHMDKLVGGEWVPTDVSTSEFADVRNDENWRLLNDNPDEAFSEFRDTGTRGIEAFLQDVKVAISQGKFGPAWGDFIECLTNGSIFAIITARGHEPEAIRLGIEWIIDNVLTEEQVNEMYNNLLKFEYMFERGEGYSKILRGQPSQNELVKKYLEHCDLVGVSSPSRGGSPSSPEKAKEDALMEFKSKVNQFASNIGTKAKIGFSDDDLGNVKHVEDLIDNLHHEKFPNIVHYVVKGTKDPSSITKKVRSMGEITETAHQTPGLESSVLPFTQFNNMTNKLYPSGDINRQDDFANQFRRQSEYLAKKSKEITPKIKKLKRKNKSIKIKESVDNSIKLSEVISLLESNGFREEVDVAWEHSNIKQFVREDDIINIHYYGDNVYSFIFDELPIVHDFYVDPKQPLAKYEHFKTMDDILDLIRFATGILLNRP